MNSSVQGNNGIGRAIAYFTSCGDVVSVPLTDTQEYDLIIDRKGVIFKVQVKTTTYKRGNSYIVSLKTNGGNRSGINKCKYLDPKKVDLLFVLDGDGVMYLIDTLSIDAKNAISVSTLRQWIVSFR